MDTILFLAHTENDGLLANSALEALQAARQLAAGLTGSNLVAGLVGVDVTAAAAQIAGSGVARCLGVAGADFGFPRYASDAHAAATLAQKAGATIVIAAGTSRWSRVLAGVAARLNGRIDTHVTGLAPVNGQPVATRWFYRQRMEGTLTRTTRPWVIALDPGCFPVWSGDPGELKAEFVETVLPAGSTRTTVTGVQAPPADEQTIRPDAKLLFVTGAGWTKNQADGKPHTGEAETLILDFLRHTKASLGSTKSLVDLGEEGQAVLRFLTHLNQVGQTGSTPRHPKGLATCCHGEEPHTVGWRFINERRAINLNPNCSWAQGKADVLYVADAFAVMREVNALLAAGTQV